MKASRYPLLAILLLYGITILRAQPTIFITDYTADLSSTFSLDVRAAHFDNLAGMQFAVQWDAGLLDLLEVKDLGLDINLEDHFGPQDVDQGILNFFWFDGTTQGVPIPDTTLLFSLTFSSQGNKDFVTEVGFTDLPGSPIEIFDASFNMIDATLDEGTVQIGEVTATGQPTGKNGREEARLFPNPMQAEAVWQLPLSRAQSGMLSIYTPSGKLLSSKRIHIPFPDAQIPLQAAQFPAAGIYLLDLRLDSGLRWAQYLIVD